MLSSIASQLPVLGGAAAAACVGLRRALQHQTRGLLWSVEREKVWLLRHGLLHYVHGLGARAAGAYLSLRGGRGGHYAHLLRAAGTAAPASTLTAQKSLIHHARHLQDHKYKPVDEIINDKGAARVH